MENKILKHLEKAKWGYLALTTPNGSVIDVGDKNSSRIKADIKIKTWEVIDLVFAKGDIGFGESYIKGFFSTSNIANLLTFIAKNQSQFDHLFHGNLLYSFLFFIKKLFNKNTLKGSKKNIKTHYDLGNNFYSLWLDKTMSYSSGIFKNSNCLVESQKNKYYRILDQLTGSNILEIGCGWGGFINEANTRGFEVKGITLSDEQKAYCENIIKNEHLNAKVLLQDYRLTKGIFDNIVSIEMFEAVGKEYWNQYFSKIKHSLAKNGMAVIQTITINNEFFETYLKKSDYIREYIFPGGLLASPSAFKNLAKANGLEIIDEYKFGHSYYKTLLSWLANFNNSVPKVKKLGFSPQFIRKWQFYLGYCAAGFLSEKTNVGQYTLVHA